MSKKKLGFFAMIVLFVMVSLAVIITLATPPALNAASTEVKEEGGSGKWEAVCCGTNRCGPVGDFCIGTGTLVCCK